MGMHILRKDLAPGEGIGEEIKNAADCVRTPRYKLLK